MIFGNTHSQSLLLDFFQGRQRTTALTGPAHLGKASCALSLLDTLIHPTDLLVMSEGVDGARDAVSFCRSEPLNGDWRVLFVDDAGALSEPAQDALLKICEEPHPSMKVIIVAHDPGHVQPALRSRIRNEIRWLPLSDEEMYSYAGTVSAVTHEPLLRLSSGVPGIYRALMEVAGLEDLYGFACRCIAGTVRPIMLSTPDVIKDLKGKNLTRDAVVHVLRAAARVSGNPVRSIPILDFCSTLTSSPSANAEIHWMRAAAHLSDVT